MNKIYKLIWSKVKNCYVVASELAKSHTKAPNTGVVGALSLEKKIFLALCSRDYGQSVSFLNTGFVAGTVINPSAFAFQKEVKPFKITVAAIVKNEAENVPTWVQAARSCADEIVVVDTGSTDGTVERFADYGIKCFHYEWHDDFASAKNYMISLCHGDWIVLLDGDEWFREGCDVRKAISKHHAIPITKAIIADWICLDKDRNNAVMFSGGAVRAFRNQPDVRYFRKVHENLTIGYENFVFEPDFKMYHTGYSGSVNRSKHERNLRIMRTMFDFDNGKVEFPTDWRYIEDTYAGLGQFDKALWAADKMISFGVQEYSAAAWITKFNVLFAMKTPLAEMQKQFEYCFRTVPSVSGFRFLASIYYLRNGQFELGLDNYIEGLRMLLGPQDKVAQEHTYWRMYMPEASALASSLYLQNKQVEAALYACKVSEQYCGQNEWTNRALADIRRILNQSEEAFLGNIYERILPVLQFAKKGVLATALASSLTIGMVGNVNPVYAASCVLNGSGCASGTNATVTGGQGNTASGCYSSVSGGNANKATCFYASVAGGCYNTASGSYSSVIGGWCNTASGELSFIASGKTNTASDYLSVVIGGCSNISCGCYSLVLNGMSNQASGIRSTVVGGIVNKAIGNDSTVVGGNINTANGYLSAVFGGSSNTANGNCSTVVGGSSGIAYACYSTVIGGGITGNADCAITAQYSIAIGKNATTTRDYEVVIGSSCAPVTIGGNLTVTGSNTVSDGTNSKTWTNIIKGYTLSAATSSTLGGVKIGSNITNSNGSISITKDNVTAALGYTPPTTDTNTTYDNMSASELTTGTATTARSISAKTISDYVTGKTNDKVSGLSYADGILTVTKGNGTSDTLTIGSGSPCFADGVVLAGCTNTASGCYSSVSGGCCNTASGCASSVSGGQCNIANRDYSSVSGGTNNTASGYISSISGGIRNTASGGFSSVSGGQRNIASSYASSVSGGSCNTASGSSSSVNGGSKNTASGEYSSVNGGFGNVTSSKIARFTYELVGESNASGTINDVNSVLDAVNTGSFTFYGKTYLYDTQNDEGAYVFHNDDYSNFLTIKPQSSQFAVVTAGACNSASGEASWAAGGCEGKAYAHYSSAIGGGITGNAECATTALGSVAIGKNAITARDYEVAIGSACAPVKIDGALTVDGAKTVTDGTNQKTWEELLSSSGGASYIGVNIDTGNSNEDGTGATGTDAIAIGKGAVASGDKSLSIGTGNIVKGYRSGAIGDPNIVDGSDSYIVGNNSTVHANIKNAFVLGNNTTVNNGLPSNWDAMTDAEKDAWANGLSSTDIKEGVVALGNTISVSLDNKSATSRSSTSPGTPQIQHVVALGDNVTIGEENTIGIGHSATATALDAIAIGDCSQATMEGTIAVGESAQATNAFANALGYLAQASGEGAGAFGQDAQATGKFATAFGRSTRASAESATAIGNTAHAVSQSSIAIGTSAVANGGANTNAVAIGRGAVIGSDSQGYGETVALGSGTSVQNTFGSAVGSSASVTGQKGTAVGYNSSVTALNSVALGADSVADSANTVSVGSSTSTRKIVNVTDGTADTDVSTLGQTGNQLALSNGSLQLKNANGTVLNSVTLPEGNTYTAGNGLELDSNNEFTVKSGTNVTVDAHGVNVVGNGIVSNGNAGLISGDTLYDEVRLTTDGTYAKTTNNTVQNLTALDAQVKANADAIASLPASQNLVFYDDATHANITLDGPVGTGTKITGLANGTLSSASTDAVTGQQLYQTNAEISRLDSSITSQNTTIANLSSSLTTLNTDYILTKSSFNTVKTQVDTGFNVTADGSLVKNVIPSCNFINFVGGKGIALTNSNGSLSIAVDGDASIASGDTGAVTGGLAYTELRPVNGNYVVQTTTTAQNLTALDTQLKTTTDNLATETANRQTAVSNEATARQQADTAFTNKIGSIDADGNFITKDGSVFTNLSALDTQLNTVVDNAGALSADGNYILQANTVAQNLQALDTKIGSAASANGTYTTTANTVNANLKSLDTQLKTTTDNLAQEVTDRTNAVSTEASARSTEDANLSGRIGTVADGSYNYIQQSSTKNVAENLVLLDSALKTMNDTVASNKTAIENALSTEVSNRETVDTTLQTNIDNEVTARQTAVSGEATARATADTTLQGNIDSLSDIAVKYDSADTKNKVTLAGTNGTIIDNVKDATLSATSKEAVTGSQLFATNQNLATEISDRQTAVSNEATARSDADTALSTRIGSIATNGNYLLTANNVYQNLSALDTQIKANADAIVANEVHYFGVNSSWLPWSQLTQWDKEAYGVTTEGEYNALVEASVARNYDGTGALGHGSVAIGTGAFTGPDGESVAIGLNAAASCERSISLGAFATSAINGTAVGFNSTAYAGAFAGGYEALADDEGAIAIGYTAKAMNADSIAIGTETEAWNGIAIGNSAEVDSGTAVGFGAEASHEGTAFGAGATAHGEYGVAIGDAATATGSHSIALGSCQPVALANNSLALGSCSYTGTSAVDAVSLGRNADAFNSGSIAIGADSVANSDNEVSFGHAKNDTYNTYSNNSATYTSDLFRRLTNVAAGVNDHDVVNVQQLNDATTKYFGVNPEWEPWSGLTDYEKSVLGVTTEAEYNALISSGANLHGDGASGVDSIAIGKNASAPDFGTIAIGTNAIANCYTAVAIGYDAIAGNGDVVVGQNAESHDTAFGSNPISASRNVVIGSYARNYGASNTVIGPSTEVQGTTTVGIGQNNKIHNSVASTIVGNNITYYGTTGVALGDYIHYGSETHDVYGGIVIGRATNLQGNTGIAIGDAAFVDNVYQGTAIGQNAESRANSAIGFGNSARSYTPFGIAIGFASHTSLPNTVTDPNLGSNIAIGDSSYASDVRTVALGYNAEASASGAIAIGSESVATSENEVSFGHSANDTYENGYLQSATYDTPLYRKLTHVADGVADHDAATVGQIRSAVSDGLLTADGVVEKDNTGLVSGGTVWSALNTGRNLGSSGINRIGTNTMALGGVMNVVEGSHSMSIGSDISEITGEHSFAMGSHGANIPGNNSVSINSVDLGYETYKDDPDFYNRYLVDGGGTVLISGNNSTAIGTYGETKKNPEGSSTVWSTYGASRITGDTDLVLGGSRVYMNGNKSVSLGGEYVNINGNNDVSIGGFTNTVQGNDSYWQLWIYAS